MINEIKEALEKATAGPWADNVFEPYTTVYSYDHLTEEPDGIIARCEHEEDAHLISNTPTYIRYLLDELEKAQKNVEVHKYAHRLSVHDLISASDELDMMKESTKKLRTEHTAMKNYLLELRAETSHDHIASQISNVLSTLSTEASHE